MLFGKLLHCISSCFYLYLSVHRITKNNSCWICLKLGIHCLKCLEFWHPAPETVPREAKLLIKIRKATLRQMVSRHHTDHDPRSEPYDTHYRNHHTQTVQATATIFPIVTEHAQCTCPVGEFWELTPPPSK